MKKDLTTFLQEKQTKGSWLEIGQQFNVPGTPKQQSDYVRNLWKSLHRQSGILSSTQGERSEWNSIPKSYIDGIREPLKFPLYNNPPENPEFEYDGKDLYINKKSSHLRMEQLDPDLQEMFREWKDEKVMKEKEKKFLEQVDEYKIRTGFGTCDPISSSSDFTFDGEDVKRGGNNNVLFIGDIHEPFCKEGYLEFCKEQYNKFNCNKVIFAGDIVDFHAQSMHDSDADGMSAIDELIAAIKNLQKWYKVFPEATVLLGNHDRIVARKLFKVGLSQRWMKPLGEVLEVPNWNFVEQVIYNGILYCHGEGGTARKKAQQEMMSCCQGHLHSEGYVELLNGGKNFALQVGCGIDFSSYAFAYAKRDKKPILSCAVILDQSPILIPFQ